jgi:hypothetical protein
VDFPSFIKSTAQRDPEFIEAIEPRWSGAFPATLIYDASGKLRFFFEGARPYRAFEQKVLEVLTQTSANTVSESGGK